MTNLPYGLMETLVADHQRELQDFASRRRVVRRRRNPPQTEARSSRRRPTRVAGGPLDAVVPAT
jgi:hypothetical protein